MKPQQKIESKPGLKLVVSNESVALTDQKVLAQAKDQVSNVINHVAEHGIENTGEEWVLESLQMAERRLEDVLGKLNSLKRKMQAIK